MKTLPAILLSSLGLAAIGAFAQDGIALEREAQGNAFRFRIGPAYRGGMKLDVKGTGSHAAGVGGSSSKTSGSASNGSDSSSADLSVGYNGGDRTFGSGTRALGSGTIHADRTYVGGDYSSVYDDVYFSDNRTSTETVGGRTSTKSTTSASGAMSWDDDDFDAWGVRMDAELPLWDFDHGIGLGLFAGLRGWWGMEGRASGSGVAVNTRTTTTTSGAQTRTTESFYDVTAPLDLDGKLDFDNAEVFQGSTTTYAPAKGSSRSTRTSAVSVAKVEADADLYQIPVGLSLRYAAGRFSFAIQPALLLNVVDGDATRTEVLATAAGKVVDSWRDTGSESKFALGAGADLAVECSLAKGCGIWVSGGYEWIDSVEIEVGPNKAELDMGGWTASVGLSFAF